MSQTKPPAGGEPASLQTTRQMLDELDALMERMLALPVNDLEEPAPALPEIVRMPTVSATLTVLESPVEEEQQPEPVPVETTIKSPSFSGYVTDLEPAETEPAAIEAIEPEPIRQWTPPRPQPIPEELIPPSVMTLPAPRVTPLDLKRRSVGSLCLLPLFWMNQGFDKCTTFLGWPGSILRGQRGRHLMGMTGLGLLVAAALWLLKDWLGWAW